MMNYLEFDKKVTHAEICPYCGKKPKFVDSKVIYGKSYGMVYYCENCDAYVGVHKGTDQALGRLANRELRTMKKKAHYYFDQLWKRKIDEERLKHKSSLINNKKLSKIRRKARSGAYNWLSQKMNLLPENTHIGMFDISRCEEVIKLCKPYCYNFLD